MCEETEYRQGKKSTDHPAHNKTLRLQSSTIYRGWKFSYLVKARKAKRFFAPCRMKIQ